MKKIQHIALRFFAAVVSVMAFTSCFGEHDTPKAPDTQLSANITIRELIDRFGKYSYTALDSAWYIEGVVVGNDVSGNIYKKIFLQDETAGIDIEIEMTNNHHKYPVGQRLVISLKGLAMGLYGGQPQIAAQGNNVTQRLYEPECDEHFFRKGFASAQNMPAPILTTIHSLEFRPTNYIGCLVQIDSVYFKDLGITFATDGDAGNGSNRNLLDKFNNTIVCRNSTKSLFANDILPVGMGTVRGIVGIYNGTLQFTFRSADDLENFAIPTPNSLTSEYDSIEQKATLRWNRLYPYTDSLCVYCKKSSDADYNTFITVAKKDEMEIKDLTPNTSYQWKIQAWYNHTHYSAVSEEQTFFTGSEFNIQ